MLIYFSIIIKAHSVNCYSIVYTNKGKCLTVPSAKAEMTFPRAERDLLMFLASSRTAPAAPVLLTWNKERDRASDVKHE